MLKKLLKYDLKNIYKVLLLLYGMTIICAIGSIISNTNNESLIILNILNTGFKILTFSSIAIILVYNMIKLWSRFKNTVYGDESYLIHTLPITKNDIYVSKILTALITITASVVVSFIALLIIYGIPQRISYHSFDVEVVSSEITEEQQTQIIQRNIDQNRELALEGYKESINMYCMNFLIVLIFLIWVALTGYFAIILGNIANKNIRTEAIIMGISLFFLCICVNYLILGTFTIFGKDSFYNGEITMIEIAYYGLICIIYYVLGLKQLKNNMNVI